MIIYNLRHSLFHILIFFFFSSRRRHTRYWRDWSSDVCSSDLPEPDPLADRLLELVALRVSGVLRWRLGHGTVALHGFSTPGRSEERRVGKECRSRWSPYH